jgi:hypothetical protein
MPLTSSHSNAETSPEDVAIDTIVTTSANPAAELPNLMAFGSHLTLDGEALRRLKNLALPSEDGLARKD